LVLTYRFASAIRRTPAFPTAPEAFRSVERSEEVEQWFVQPRGTARRRLVARWQGQRVAQIRAMSAWATTRDLGALADISHTAVRKILAKASLR
jgi:hypothetical protein